MQSTYLKNRQKVKAHTEKVYLWYKHKITDRFLRVNHPLLQLVNIMDRLLSTAALFSRFYSHRIHSY